MLDLVVLGDCPVELWCRNRFTADTQFRSRVGGDSFPLAQAAVRLGLKTGLMTRLGDDLFEGFIRDALLRAGIETSRCLTVSGGNGVIFSHGDRASLKRSYRRAGSSSAAFTLLDPDLSYLEGSRWFYSCGEFQALSVAAQDGVFGAFKAASDAGIRTAFGANLDPTLRVPAAARAALLEIAPMVELLFVNPTQIAPWLGTAEPARVARWALEQGMRLAVVRGDGCVTAVATSTLVESFAAERPSDTRNPPPDAELDAGFLAGLVAGLDPVSAARDAGRQGAPATPDLAPAPATPTPATPPTDAPAPDASRGALVYVDGGSRGNPGAAGAGVYFELDGKPWRGLYEYLGNRTNNYAEYSALLRGLRYALEHGLRRLSVCSDSELLVRQIKGIYRVKNPALQKLHAEAEQLIRRFERFSIRHVPREQNKKADALANKAQDERGSGEETYA